MLSNNNLPPITEEMLKLTEELQNLNELKSFHLGGGTALTMYFQHRVSDDIDLISSKSFSKPEILILIDNLLNYFKDRIIGKMVLNDLDGTTDNLLFLRFYVLTDKEPIKVELIQNVYCKELDPNIINNIRVLPVELIAILKLAAANDRAADKDIYDMYFLTKDNTDSLYQICNNFDEYKFHISNNPELISLFDQRINSIPLLKDPKPLLTFQDIKNQNIDRLKLPIHSNHNITPINNNVKITVAKSLYRQRINSLFRRLGIERDKPKGF